MTTFRKILSIAVLAVGLSSATTPFASASTGQEFGHHVRSCAQTMGFDGSHNPGMHTGYAGWDPSHVC
ncbi:hypothetical protein GCM10011376_15290 [Nocardioides flavus (ex Wang et al. 2016)]|uniref:Uncharacterized protein n=1 Tax=Nocardioides flavus (ex Wang et al. 2016) TaxID=2058780 RepID=A0ABQ3HLB8_9ACTN|nr:hypothetical protein [Nocardioides flavus (ex Wang et al. 2016)]GHE16919.1 hypothetical protein GCM10011376_15290 [Nocardioides flavus (ex Wang et al. 2016)]